MVDKLFNLIVSLIILDLVINIVIILPKLRRYKTVLIRDWFFVGIHHLDNLKEYKKICENENVPLTWYYIKRNIGFITLGGMLVFFVSMFFC